MLAFVTGGSRGLGQSITIALAQAGYDIAFVSTQKDASVESVIETVKKLDRNVYYEPCDISDFSAVKQMANNVIKKCGVVDVLVNNAGISADSSLVTMKEEDWHKVLDINLSGTFNVCRNFAFEMMKKQKGSIINISSGVALQGGLGITNYAASKAGVIGFSQSLAKEMGPFGIRVNTVTPGYIDCGLFEKINDKQKEWILKHVPLGVLGDPSDVSNLVVFLASEKSKYINKAVIPVDGGIGL
ncbi:3-oxoacyl-ACP reductase FabG [Aliikangiella sp. IMCC44359]|uniref:3-oxoacyl-ACP reductase FabG n=1 Tax=Aliikangiella sp. IMCC44359 TaxID=3459125 RepID=UPI00403AC8F1